ncbi:PilZ domain-containing protein [Endothiovibrio diazotrophicus]
MSDHERRHFHRILFDAEATLGTPERRWTTRLIDISLKGVLLIEPEEFVMEGPLTLSLPLGDDPEGIHMELEVAHRERGQIGATWKDIDVDSFSHLRRLIELNTGDPDLVDRELSELTAG